MLRAKEPSLTLTPLLLLLPPLGGSVWSQTVLSLGRFISCCNSEGEDYLIEGRFVSRQLLPVLFHKEVFLQGHSSVPSFQSYPSLSRGVLLLGEHKVLLPTIKLGYLTYPSAKSYGTMGLFWEGFLRIPGHTRCTGSD